MSHEILYTSAPRLLKPGMTGYGTVVSTRGISSHLADKLESLSGYRWAFEQGDPQARLNPVCHSHVVIAVAGQKYHVLSRVADYGADYSGRSNKIAHHVALSESELTPGGPGWVLKSPGFCEARWDEQLKVIDAGRQPTRSVRDSADYSVWKRVMGDAGWAGALAETVGSTDRRAVHVIFPLGTDVLGLVEESLNLLPHRDRWNVSFSTYFNVLPASVDCHWRFVLDGTTEATNLRRQPHQRVIDLCRPLGPAIGGELVQRAREAWQPAFGPPSHVPVMAPVQPQSTAAVSQPRQTAPAASLNRVDADVPAPPSPTYSPPVPVRYASPNSGTRSSAQSGWRLPLWATLLLCLLIGAGSGGAGFLLGQWSEKQKIAKGRQETSPSARQVEQEQHVDNAGKKADNTHSPSKPPKTEKRKTDSVSEETGNQKANTPRPEEREVVSESTGGSQGGSAAPTHKQDMSPEGKQPSPVAQDESHNDEKKSGKLPENSPSLDIHEGYIELPDYVRAYKDDTKAEYTLEGKITDFLPEVFGAAFLLGNKTFAPPKLNKENQTWILLGSDEKKPMATFKVDNGKLAFQWQQNADSADISILRQCLIRLESKGKPILLSKPFAIRKGCLLPDTKPAQVDLLQRSNGSQASLVVTLENTIHKLSFGKWRFDGIPSEYQVQGMDSRLTTTSNEHQVGLQISKDGIELAVLKVELRRQDAKDKKSVHSVVQLALMSMIPSENGKTSEKLWTLDTRTSKKERFSLDSIKSERDKITSDKSAYDTKVAEYDRVEKAYGIAEKDNKTTFKDKETFDAGKVKYEEYKRKYKEENEHAMENLMKLEEWRSRMDALTMLFESKVTFSFDVFYDVRIDDKDVPVILGTVTTVLPSTKVGQPAKPEASVETEVDK